MDTEHDLQRLHTSHIQDFWGELSPVEHSLQIYRTDDEFLNTLESFVHGGLSAGETVIVIATLAHRTALEKRLQARDIDLTAASALDQYIALDARTALSAFMVDNNPDETLFKQFIGDLLARAHTQNRRVRAFGEMVAVLWMHGHRDATLRLETLWNKFCEEKDFCLFCAYPRSDFTQDDLAASLAEICATHSRVIGA